MPVAPIPRQAGVSSWFATRAGRALLQLQQPIVVEGLRSRPTQPWLLLAAHEDAFPEDELPPLGVHLRRSNEGYAGDLRCALPLPLAPESVQAIIVQHPACDNASELLEECERVLMPGGKIWLFTLNPLSPYRLRWRRYGLDAMHCGRWRMLAHAAGLQCLPHERYLGPVWKASGTSSSAWGVPWRALCLIEIEKRVAAPIGPIPVGVSWRRPAVTI